MYKIPLVRPYFDHDELEEIQKTLDSGWVSAGPKVEEFEKALAKFLGAEHVIGVANCTAALHLSLLSLGVGEGDEVLVADYTFPATAHAVLYCGAKPVFVDVDLRTYNIDPMSIAEKITERTKAIVPVHAFGQPAEMDEILRIAKAHNLRVLEDAACALGAKYKDRYAGTMGDIACISLHARKGITTGEGGLIVTNDRSLAEKARNMSVFGMTSSAWNREGHRGFVVPQFTDVGYNYKMSDINAAVGVAQLRKLDKILRRKRDLAKHWNEEIEHMDLVTPPYVAKHVEHCYQTYVAVVDGRVDRNGLIETLGTRGIQTNIGTYSCHLQPVYNSKDSCPRSAQLFNTAIALPLYYSMQDADIELAAASLRQSVAELA